MFLWNFNVSESVNLLLKFALLVCQKLIRLHFSSKSFKRHVTVEPDWHEPKFIIVPVEADEAVLKHLPDKGGV